jgi:hypothetical protein
VKLHTELHLADLITDIAKRQEQISRTYPNSKYHASKQFPISLDNFSWASTNSGSIPQGIQKPQVISVETYSIGRDSTASGQQNAFGGSDPGLGQAVVGGAWLKWSVSAGGGEEPLTEEQTWETFRKDSGLRAFGDSKQVPILGNSKVCST